MNDDILNQLHSLLDNFHNINDCKAYLDILNYYYIASILDVDDLPCSNIFLFKNLMESINYKNYFVDYFKNLKQNKIMLEQTSSFLEDIDKNWCEEYTNKFTYNESINMVFDFFSMYDKNAYITLSKLTQEKKIYLTNKDISLYGAACGGYSNNCSSCILINNFENFSLPVTIAHETFHILTYKILNSLDKKTFNNFMLNYSMEINTYLLELFFYDFFYAKYPDDVDISLKEYDLFHDENIDDLSYFLYGKKNLYTLAKDSTEFICKIKDFYGKYYAYILYSLNDLEKAKYITDLFINNPNKLSNKQILLNNGIDIFSESVDENVRSLIKKHWS